MAKEIASEQPPTSLPLENRVAIVTGASGGIGRAIALHLASLGAKLVLSYSSSSAKADLLASEINALASPSHPRAIAVRANVSDSNQVKDLFDEGEKAFGTQIHILVHCAAVVDPNCHSLATISEEDWDMIFSINAKGSFLCSREAAKRLKHGGGGRIILFSSSLVSGPNPGFGAYTASKAAVETMTRILAKELKGTGITANCVAPGLVATDMFFNCKADEEQVKIVINECPFGRVGETKDVAPIVGFLASDAGEWINGQVIRPNGGYI